MEFIYSKLYRIIKNILIIISVLILTACDDGDVFIQDKSILEKKIKCLELIIFPPNDMIENSLKKLYHFKQDCRYKLIVSYKSSIICNSNQNADKKAIGLPKSYLRLEIKKDTKLYYTYYKDLKDNLDTKDIKNGFDIIKSDLDIK